MGDRAKKADSFPPGDGATSGVRATSEADAGCCRECGCDRWVPVMRAKRALVRRMVVIAVQCEDCGRTPY